MDLDDAGAPSEVSVRIHKFKTHPKLKPRPPPKAEAVPEQECQDSDALDSVKVKFEEDSKPVVIDTIKNESSMSNVSDTMEEDAEVREDDPMEEEVDAVVREIDVFFKPVIDANTKLYVLQYPLRPSWRPYELDTQCEEVRVKPVSKEVEVDLSIDTNSENYDQSKTPSMPKLTLSSLWNATRTSSYAIGIMMNNKLYLNPVNAVVQLRPSREHLKSGSGGSKKKNKQMESSIQQKPDDDEHWIPLKYHGSESDISTRYLKKMVVEESSPIHFMMRPYDYLNSLCPGVCNNTKTKGPTRKNLFSLPLEERIQKLLCEGLPIKRFIALKHFAPEYSTEDVLGVLQKHARLVQGHWVPKITPDLDNTASLVRDYILLLFSKDSVVKTTQINLPYQLGTTVKDCLQIYSVERPSLNDWKFKENTDFAFIKLYPDIVKNQEQIWMGVETQVTEFMFGGAKNSMVKPSKPRKSLKSDKGEKSASGVQTGMPMSNETREALSKALQKLFQSHKVCSFGVICEEVRNSAVFKGNQAKVDASSKMAVNAAYGLDAPPKELHEIISQYAIEIHGHYVLKSSPEHPEHDPLRGVVIDLLRGKERNAKLKKAEITQAAKFALKRDITNNEYNKVMNDFCEFKNSAWVLKTGHV